MVGVVQEQHAERAKLYKQWKNFEFTILQDATTQLDLWAVPMAVLIDEYGVIRGTGLDRRKLANFVDQEFKKVAKKTEARNTELGSDDFDEWMAKGNKALHQSGSDASLAIEHFSKAVQLEPKNGKAVFSLGVAYRWRFDSKHRRPGDFAKAAGLWREALRINPNQYIWRRRIEQYGPGLTKPYPFYDWVEKAKEKISQRGDTPVSLTVALTGTEIVKGRSGKQEAAEVKNPDPEAKIFEDPNDSLQISCTIVPSVSKEKKLVRVHLELELQDCKWNDEAGPTIIWVDESSTGMPEKRLLEGRSQGKPNRKLVDFEFTKKTPNEQSLIKGFALFHCCDKDGVCFYYRKDFRFSIAAK